MKQINVKMYVYIFQIPFNYFILFANYKPFVKNAYVQKCLYTEIAYKIINKLTYLTRILDFRFPRVTMNLKKKNKNS